jgi:hypothetical protein
MNLEFSIGVCLTHFFNFLFLSLRRNAIGLVRKRYRQYVPHELYPASVGFAGGERHVAVHDAIRVDHGKVRFVRHRVRQ